jgi:signal peptidase II
VSGEGARAWRLSGALCGLVVVLDQSAKALVQAHLVPGQQIDVLGPVKLTLTHNSGVAFGLAGGGGAGLILLTVAALAFVGVLFARNPTRPGMWVAVGLLAGGAFGNLADRVRIDSVTDFVDLPLWPTFNLADIAITAGVVLLALIYLRGTES